MLSMQPCNLDQSHEANLPPSFFVVKKVFAMRPRREGFFLFSSRGGERFFSSSRAEEVRVLVL